MPARWAGVPFVMKAGKALNERKVEIRVQFKPPAAGIHKNSLNGMRNELVVRDAGGFMCGPSRPRAYFLRAMRRCCTLLCVLHTAGMAAMARQAAHMVLSVACVPCTRCVYSLTRQYT